MSRLALASAGLAFLLAVCTLLSLVVGSKPVANQERPDSGPVSADAAGEAIGQIVRGGNRFAVDLYAELRSADGNLFLSPSSISMALSMTCAGAEGATREQMLKTLHLPVSAAERDAGMRALLASWTEETRQRGFRLRVANRLWAQQSYTFLPAFLDTTRTAYGAELARLDFAQATEASRQTINRWVEEQTENKITDLISAGVLTRDSKLVLTNAVYFKGDWTSPFRSELTKPEEFHIASDKSVQTPLMHREGAFRYAAAEDMQVLELPYGDESLSMVVLLPDEVEGLAGLEARLTSDNLQQWMTSLRSQEVLVYLPRFKTTAEFELNTTLAKLGMPAAFDPSTADFSGMTGRKDLFISKVVHKAFVDVNEEGTEAAAATGVIMTRTGAPLPQSKPVFRADHPFLFVIRDNRTQAILFLGRLINPQS
ncbi:MAG: serpin family protein [Pirellulaceae bacterium]